MRTLKMGLFVWLLATGLGFAQTAEDAWDNLKQLRMGQKVEVVDMNLKSLKGSFTDLSEQGISIQTDEGEKVINRASVLRVSVRGGKRARNAWIGLAVGGGAGAAIGAGVGASKDASAEDLVAFIVLPALAGAGVGGGVGAAFPGTRTIYRAPKRQDTGEGP